MAKRRDEIIAWRGPTVGWLAILVLLGGVLAVNEIATGALRFLAAMCVAGFMLGALALGPVGVIRERRLTRLIGGAGFLFILILFLLSFADLLTRLR